MARSLSYCSASILVIGAAVSAVAGSLYGLAYGDALGAPTEFRTVAEIHSMYGTGGPRDLPAPALVTDDTQMALAVAAALAESGELRPDGFAPRLRARFLDWWQSPDNDRAPGMTCLNACAALASGGNWRDATVVGSKGCGANMRVTPIALPRDLRLEDPHWRRPVAGGDDPRSPDRAGRKRVDHARRTLGDRRNTP